MQIAHLHLGSDFAGSETYAASLAKLQAQAGHQVRVLVRQGPQVGRWRRQAGPAAVLVLPRWAVGPLARWVAARYMAGFMPQILHSHLGGAHRLGAHLGQALKTPHVATMHLRYKPKEHATCQGLIAIAHWQVAEIPPTYKGKHAVVWNWLPEPVKAPLAAASSAGPDNGVFTFGSVGRLHPHKGMGLLVQAFQQAFAGQPQVRLEIVGEGAERPALETLIAGDSRIRLWGNQPHTAPFYARWQAYVSAARYEPFGLTILEAMAHNLPLVCTRTAGPNEFLAAQPQPPLWAEPDDLASLAQALQACYRAGVRWQPWEMVPFQGNIALGKIMNFYESLMPDAEVLSPSAHHAPSATIA
jgi:glycosyltransferase involved in cell wall biosynthesis